MPWKPRLHPAPSTSPAPRSGSKPQTVAPGLPWVPVAATGRRKEAGGLACRPQAQGPGTGRHQQCPTLPGWPEGW